MPSGFFSLPTWDTAVIQPGLPKCGTCGLLRQCYSPKMEVAGRGRRSILVVGEAPGENEDRQGQPFVGEAGQRLRKTFKDCGLDLDDCWVTNSIVCRPPKNVIDDKYIDSCRPLLLQTIEDKKPNVIILLGASAAKTLIGQEWKKDFGQLTRWLGWHIPSQRYGAWLCPTYHPSYILRMGEDQVLVQEFRNHIAAALRLEKRTLPDNKDVRSQVEIVDERGAKTRLIALAKQQGRLGFDYETNGLKPDDADRKIVTCSFCLEGDGTWATKMTPELMPHLSKVLKQPALKKIASNMKFEERWTRAKLGHGVRRWWWDTMLAAHFLDNRSQITSIKFQAYVRLGVAGYDQHIDFADGDIGNFDKIEMNELLIYNGLDSLLEYRVMLDQRDEYRRLQC